MMGIARTASVIGEDGVEYSNLVASACCNPIRIPQKGRRFAVTLLARAGGSEVSFEKAFYENLKMMIKGRSDLLPATSISTAGPRISETKTVLSSLKIAKVEKGETQQIYQFSNKGEKSLSILFCRVKFIRVILK